MQKQVAFIDVYREKWKWRKKSEGTKYRIIEF